MLLLRNVRSADLFCAFSDNKGGFSDVGQIAVLRLPHPVLHEAWRGAQ